MFSRTARDRQLRNLDLFTDCTDAELAAVESLTTRLRINNGRTLLREGACDRQFMVIVEGEVGVSRNDGSPVAMLSRGDVIGEIAMLGGRQRSATVTTLSPTEILVCNSLEFATLIDAVPSVREKLLRTAAGRVAANAQAA